MLEGFGVYADSVALLFLIPGLGMFGVMFGLWYAGLA